MKTIRKFAALYFNLSRKESNGFIILCGLVFVFIFLPVLTRTVYSSGDISPDASEQQRLDSIVALLEEPPKSESKFFNTRNFQHKKTIYSSFNPNNASEAELITAGVPRFIAVRIVKFRASGAVFRNKEDLRKLYGLTESTYQELLPHIDLPEKTENIKHNSTNAPQKTTVSSFDLNKADSTQLLSLKGIGPVLASRMVRYRKKLGGYISVEQLHEIYGLDSSVVKTLAERIYIIPGFVPVTINLNTADEMMLQSHPYIGKKAGKAILSYRSQHGRFNSTDELKNIHAIAPEWFGKMLPYLSVE